MRCAKTGKKIVFVPKRNPAIEPFYQAYHELIRNRTWKLCHGVIWIVTRTGKRSPRPHAWLEKQGMAWDVFHNLLTTTERFYSLHQIEQAGLQRYTAQQAKIELESAKTYWKWAA
jgi:hypothetical protein